MAGARVFSGYGTSGAAAARAPAPGHSLGNNEGRRASRAGHAAGTFHGDVQALAVHVRFAVGAGESVLV